ncbi:MAG: hypothetical protein AAFV37_10600 [Pseudomonadota bacterium]
MSRSLLLVSTAMILSACGATDIDLDEPAPETIDVADTVETLDLVESEITAEQLQIAEQMIDAFYSYDPDQLRPLLAAAEESSDGLLWYQGWAEGGNYKIVNRGACVAKSATEVDCPITVEDDPVLALGLEFKVTDTFTLTFDGPKIVNVDTSSNDKPIYYVASVWVRTNYPEIMEGPCEGFFAGGPTPQDCARAMADGYAKFAASDDFPEGPHE